MIDWKTIKTYCKSEIIVADCWPIDYSPIVYIASKNRVCHLENQNVSSVKMHKIEIGKVGNFSAWKISQFSEFSDQFSISGKLQTLMRTDLEINKYLRHL